MSENVKINDNLNINYNEEDNNMEINTNTKETLDCAKAGVALGMTCGAIIEIKAASVLAKSEVQGFWKFVGVAVLCSNAADLFKQAASIFVKPEEKCDCKCVHCAEDLDGQTESGAEVAESGEEENTVETNAADEGSK